MWHDLSRPEMLLRRCWKEQARVVTGSGEGVVSRGSPGEFLFASWMHEIWEILSMRACDVVFI